MKKKGVLIFALTISMFILGIIVFISEGKNSKWIEIEMFPVEICSDADYIYFLGNSYDAQGDVVCNVYRMNKKDYFIEEMSNLKSNAHMAFKKMTFGNDDLYILVHDMSNESKYVIWEIHGEDVVQVYDVSKWINPSEGEVRSFIVDEQGQCYMRDEKKAETIIIDLSNGEGRKFMI